MVGFAGRSGPRVQADERRAGGCPQLGVEHARGEYVAFLDSDDLLLPWALATYAKIIEEHGRPSFVTAAVLSFDHPHVPMGVERAPISVKVFPDYFASGDKWRWYGMSSFVVKRECLAGVGGFRMESLSGEDLELSMRLGEAPGFVHIQAPVTMAYREHKSGLHHVARRVFLGCLDLLSRENAGRYPGGAARAWERWRIIGRHVRACGFACLDMGLQSEAWRLYRATWSGHVRERRWRYLVGFPIMAAARALKPNSKS